MAPDLWREYIGPRLGAMCARIRAAGKVVFPHSCGRIQELVPELVECGVDVLSPFQPEVMDVYEMKRRHGSDICFFGGVSTQRTLPYGTVQETKAEVRRLLDEAGRDGGLIAAPTHDVPADARPGNVAAMIKVFRNQ